MRYRQNTKGDILYDPSVTVRHLRRSSFLIIILKLTAKHDPIFMT